MNILKKHLRKKEAATSEIEVQVLTQDTEKGIQSNSAIFLKKMKRLTLAERAIHFRSRP